MPMYGIVSPPKIKYVVAIVGHILLGKVSNRIKSHFENHLAGIALIEKI